MPIYEYECTHCGHQLDAEQRMSDAALTDCPSCQKPNLQRLVSQSSFALRGSGWYADGYGAKKEAPSEAKPAAKTAESTAPAAAADAKPEAVKPAETKTEPPAAPAVSKPSSSD